MTYEIFYEFLFKKFEWLSFLRLFSFITFRAAAAIMFAIILSLIIGPALIKFLQKRKIGQTVRDDGPQTHLTKSGTPTMGGLLILFVVCISTILFADLSNKFVWLLIFSTMGFGLIGFVDDYLKLTRRNPKGLQGKFKFTAQTILALGIMLFIYSQKEQIILRNVDEIIKLDLFFDKYGEIYFPFFDKPIFSDIGWLYIPFGMIVIIGASNAVNITDGLDGLATGLSLLVAMTFAVLSYLAGNAIIAQYLKIPYIQESAELTVFLTSLIGALIGFLWFNSHPATVFMGDTGSLAIGGTIGVVALLIKKEFVLLIAGGIFVIEVLSVVIQVIYFKWKKKRLFKMAPLHHHFEMKGWHENKVITRFWIIGAILALVAIASLKIQ